LEELSLDVVIEDRDGTSSLEERCFGLRGLKLQGAVSNGNKLSLTSAIMSDLPLTRLRWTHVQSTGSGQQGSGTVKQPAGRVTLPVYLNANRANIIFTVDLQVAKLDEELSFYERGVALIASTSLN